MDMSDLEERKAQMNTTTQEENLTAQMHSLRASVAALTRVSQPGYDGREATRAAREASWRKYEKQVDPEGVLSEEERTKRAKSAWSADMARSRLKAVQTRRSNVRRSGGGKP